MLSETVTRLRGAKASDGYGDDEVDWSEPARLDIPSSEIQPLQGGEETFNRDMVTSRWRWWCTDPDADVTELDRIEHRGAIYEIDGSVQRWWADGDPLAHATALLMKVEG